MSIFRTYLKIVARHKVYMIIYLVILNLLGIMMALSAYGRPSSQDTATVSSWSSPKVAVIDRDGSEISRGITDFVDGKGTAVSLDDTEQAIQDATAQDRISYILVIPAGYGAALMNAATTGSAAPALQTVVSYQSSEGTLMDLQVKEYLQSAYGFASTVATSQGDVVQLAEDSMERQASTSVVASEAAPVFDGFTFYCEFSTYTLFAAIVVNIIVLMKTINQRDLRRRVLATPTSSSSRGMQLLCACAITGLVSWAWVCVGGLVIFGQSSLVSSPVQVLIMCTSLLAYAVVVTACGFFLGQLAVSENAANAIANIGGMILSFFGGAWVSMDLLPASIRAAAHFVPSYWCVIAISGAGSLADTSSEAVAPLVADIGVTLLFALVLIAVALAFGRARMQEA